jgi:hypothetical protein
MALSDDLERAAAAAGAHGAVTAVLAAEPVDGARRYVVALGDGDERRWIVLDTEGRPVTRREDVRDAASIAAMCEVAADVADGLGIPVAAAPRVASPGFLDEVGAAGAGNQEFTGALRAGTGAVQEFVREVERGYALPLR